MVDFYRRLLHRQTGNEPSGESDMEPHLSAAIEAGQTDPEQSIARIERSLEALRHIDRNANQATLLEAWIDDLRLAQSGTLVEM